MRTGRIGAACGTFFDPVVLNSVMKDQELVLIVAGGNEKVA